MPLALNSEVFLIPDRGSYLLYAPLRRVVIRAAAAHINLLVRLQEGRAEGVPQDDAFIGSLVEAGLINGEPEPRLVPQLDKAYEPTRLTLLLTTRCNLRCTYCYAGGQTHDLVMDTEVGRAAIDQALRNCLSRQVRVLDLAFHGGGEPTMAWPELVALTEYAAAAARERGVGLRAGLATNACFSREQARWIAARFCHLNISLDGPPRIQDRMRPQAGGGPSSPAIRRTLSVLEDARVPYSFQATVTRETVREMPRIVDYFARFTKPLQVKFEPVTDCGRFAGRRDEVPSAEEFAEQFIRASERGQARGLQVVFSGIRLWGGPMGTFCGAFDSPFAVTPDGLLTACYEAFCASSALANTFVFGQYDRLTRSFQVDLARLRRLRARHVTNLASCANCFCKYSCAGDCATRNFRFFGGTDLTRVGARCAAIRAISRQQLAGAVDAGRRQDRIDPSEGGLAHGYGVCAEGRR